MKEELCIDTTNQLEEKNLILKSHCNIQIEREKVRQLESENMKLTEKSEYLDMITKSPNAVPITVIAKDYDMSAQEMNGWLRCIGVQYKLRCGTWVLYQAYVGNGYTKSNTFMYDPVNCKTAVHTQWTQKGRRFIYAFDKGKSPETIGAGSSALQGCS